jgi:hypothetical protein
MSGTTPMIRPTSTSRQVRSDACSRARAAAAAAAALRHCLIIWVVSRARSALRQSQNFEKKDDIQYRLGVIHKQQKKYDTSLQVWRCLRHALMRHCGSSA